MGLYKDGTRKADLSQGKQPRSAHAHKHPLANPRLRVASVCWAFFCVCSRPPLPLHWQLQPQLGRVC